MEEEDEELARAIALSMEIRAPLASMPLEQQASSSVHQTDPQLEARLSHQQQVCLCRGACVWWPNQLSLHDLNV